MLILTDQKGERQVTVDELSKKVNIPVEKLSKSRRFELNPSFNGVDLGNSDYQRKSVFKTPSGITKPAVFTFRDSDGYDCSLRYCTQVPHKKRTNDGVVDVYTPRKVRIEGEGTHAQNNDLAVWMWLNPANNQSPYRRTTYWLWQLFDQEEIANSTVESVDRLFDALSHVNNLSADNMVIFAKGIGLSVGDKSAKEVRAQLLTIAKDDPEGYLKRTTQELVNFHGLVQDAIDRGIFIQKESHGTSFWTWAEGPYKGVEILFTDKSKDANEMLKDFVTEKDNVAFYWVELNKSRNRSLSEGSAEDILRDLVNPSKRAAPKTTDSDRYVPETFADAEEYLKGAHPEGKNPSKPQASKFMKGIKAGEITYENIEDEALNYIAGT